MSGLSSIFDIGRSALFAAQRALSVTAQNVANVNTPGYSRQRTVLAAANPVDALPGQSGRGVSVVAVQRSVDAYLEGQLTTAYESVGRSEMFRAALLRVQGLFNDSASQGIGEALVRFFGAWDDVAAAPGEITARAALLASAQTLAQRLNQAQSDLAANRTAIDQQVRQTLTEINDRALQLADLNQQIVAAEARGQNANDLRDRRTVVLNELAERIEVTALEDATGSLTVFVGQGQTLVSGVVTYRLTDIVTGDNGSLHDVGYDSGGGMPVPITNLISGGRLKGLLDARDKTIPDVQRSLDVLAATVINEYNRIHRLGYGLDGSTGRDFFNPVTVTVSQKAANSGGASIGSGSVTANSLLTFHDYEIRFTSATAYSIVDATTGTTIKGNYTGTAIAAPTGDAPVSIVTSANDTVTVTVDGVASGTITLTGAAYTTGAALAAELQSKINADATLAAAGKSVVVVYDTTTSRFVITSNNATSSSSVNVTGGTARATLGLLTGTSTAASGTYGSPTTFTFDGLSATITGVPAAGDVFRVNSRTDAARNMTVALSDGNAVAAAATRAGVPQDGANAGALAALKGRALTPLGGATFSAYYATAAASFGAVAQRAARDADVQQALLEQLQAFRSEISGVSLDEELVAMMQYQRMFEAASRLIVLTDELLDSLLAIKR